MAAYNAARHLSEAVASVLTQTYRDFELIAVDDSSSDETPEILEAITDPRLRIIRHTKNVGAALSRNDALRAARGELIAIMDADDVCAPTRLERQVAFLDAHPDIGIVGCAIYENIGENGVALGSSFLPKENDSIQRAILEEWCFLHSSITFRKLLYECVGGYRPVFEPAEDHDFVLRMLEHTQAHNLYESLVNYRITPKGLSVVGHLYSKELGNTAIRLACRRRSGQPEDLQREMPSILQLRQRRKSPKGLDASVQRWGDSLFAARRYYEFGCRELRAGHARRALRCFSESLLANGLFTKS
jgi:glycosyltransferase involved in cell wall biosynthesis